jgi:predicted O-methyltransferase YrrM
MDSRAHAVALRAKGFLDDEEGLRLHDLARECARLGPLVEIGSYCGKSSVYLGAGARAAGGTLVCVDHHRGNEEQQPGQLYHDAELYDAGARAMDSLPVLRRTLREADLEQTAIVLVSTSAAAARIWNTPLGLLFIDGGHTFEAAQTDYASWVGKIAPGGVLAIHDLFPDPNEGGQAPITIYRQAVASGLFDELPTTKTLGVLRRR